jgi:ABC-type multidrug transport system ATPase subunit
MRTHQFLLFRMEHVDYFVNKGKKQIIHDVSLQFEPGKLSCLMGPSGSGKTTCLSLILGNAAGE